MDVKNLVMAVVGMVLAAVMIGGALLPAVESTMTKTDTFVNDGYYTLDYNIDNVIEWEQSSQFDLIVNGNVYDLRQLAGYGKDFSIIASTDLFVRATITDSYVRFASFSGEKGFWDTDSATAGNYARWEIDNGIITATYSKNSTPGEVVYRQNEKIYTLNATGTGSHVMKKSDESAYIKTDSSIVILAGLTRVGETADVGIFADGTYDNLNFTLFNAPTYSPVISDVTPTYEVGQNHRNLILLEKYNFNITITGGIVKDAQYDYFIVPTEITADNLNSPNKTISAMFGVLPIVAIAGLIMAGIYVFISRK